MKIIVSIQKPKPHTREEQEWRDIIGETKSLEQDGAEVVMLNDGSWQIESENALPVLACVLHAAEACNFPYRVLFADSGVEWKRSF